MRDEIRVKKEDVLRRIKTISGMAILRDNIVTPEDIAKIIIPEIFEKEQPKDIEDVIYRIIAYDREHRDKCTTNTVAVDKFKQQIIVLAIKKVDECMPYYVSNIKMYTAEKVTQILEKI